MADTIAKKEASEVPAPEHTWGGVYFTPRVDVHENDNELVFECDLPGVRPENIDLKFENRELILHGKVWPRHGGLWLANEYGVGDFYRAFTINEEVDPSRITAEYKLGVLTIHLPKKEEVKPHRIAIQGDASSSQRAVEGRKEETHVRSDSLASEGSPQRQRGPGHPRHV